jgi:hypothetical protein
MHAGLWSGFLYQVFQQGPAAKASHLSDFFTRAIQVMGTFRFATFLAIAVIVLGWHAIRKSLKSGEMHQNSILEVIAPIILGVIAISAACLGLLWLVGGDLYFLENARRSTIYIALFASAAIGLGCAIPWLRGNMSRREANYLLFAAVSFSVAFMLSLSWPAFEAMVVPGLALFLAAVLDGSNYRIRSAVIVICGLLVFMQARAKREMPFSFDSWVEAPIALASESLLSPELSSLHVPRDTAAFTDGTLTLIRQYSNQHDAIFTYPELGVFYALTNRWPPTFSGSHNIDVVPDALAREDAGRLLKNPPAVLIYAPESELYRLTDERLFRSGGRSGQRDIVDAVEKLAQDYKLVAQYHLQRDNHTVFVYVRPDRFESMQKQLPSRKSEATP